MRDRMIHRLGNALAAMGLVLLSACAQQPTNDPVTEPVPQQLVSPADSPVADSSQENDQELVLSQETRQEPEYYVRQGSGQFLDTGGATPTLKQPAKGDITLNFEAVDLREVVKVVFEEILGENYLIDDKVQGKVTIHTTYPVSVDAVLPILENILQMNGAALVRNGSGRVVCPCERGRACRSCP
ncbi:MAG: hypothetical protein P8171_07405 [Candidatus Thiodiazotropha sp.]